MSEQDDFAERFHRDRREHGGASQHPDDDQLARLTEEERVAAGLDAYDPDEVPPEVRGRALAVRKLEMLPIECVVRGYLAGSGYNDYRRSPRTSP